MKHNRPVNYLCCLKRLNCGRSAIPRTRYYRMRHDMRPFLIQRQNRSQFPTEPIKTTTNIGIYIQQPITETLSCIKHPNYFE
jgi:hypothetical protein